MPPINARADVSSRAKRLQFGLSLHLYPYAAYASSINVDSGELRTMKPDIAQVSFF